MTDIDKYRGEKGLKLNLGCGRNVKQGWVNVDLQERENKLDIICDLSREFPFDDESCEYIYSEHFIEHLEWLDGQIFLENCFRCLEPKGTLRLVFPDIRRILKAYVDKNYDFFKVDAEYLNEKDYQYYSSVYEDPERIRKERKDNPPPEWHLSDNPNDRKRVKLRIRKYNYLIEYIDWHVHLYGEHKTLYDEESMTGILKNIGFSKIKISEFIPEIDCDVPSYIGSSCYIEAIK